jgi:hypothetical protein
MIGTGSGKSFHDDGGVGSTSCCGLLIVFNKMLNIGHVTIQIYHNNITQNDLKQ